MKSYNVLVCGSRWGQSYIIPTKQDSEVFIEKVSSINKESYSNIKLYLKSYQELRDNYELKHSGAKLNLVGILAKGSENSINLAEKVGVPLFRSIEEVNTKIDIACVLISERLGGGEIALNLLKRGINVIMEHPVSSTLVKEAIELAKKNKVCFHVNYHFSDCGNINTFITKARELNKTQLPILIQMTGNYRTISSLLEIIARIFGTLKPFNINKLTLNNDDIPFKIFEGLIKSIPFIYNCQSNIYMQDEVNEIIANHNISLIYPTGVLSLLDSFNIPPILSKRTGEVPLGLDDFFSKPLKQSNSIWEMLSENNNDNSSKEILINRIATNRISIEKLIENIENNSIRYEQQEVYIRELSEITEKVIKEIGRLRILDMPGSKLYFEPSTGKIFRT